MAAPLFEEAGEEPLVPPRKSVDSDIDITSMIDCVFLLLIFFMVTSTMQGTPDVDVPVAQYGTGVPTQNATVITIERAVGGASIIRLGDGKGPEAAPGEVKEFVERGTQELPPKRLVIIKADRAVPHGVVQQVVREVRTVEGVSFTIGVRDPE